MWQSSQLLDAGMLFPSYLPAGIHQFNVGALLLPVLSHWWLWNLKGFCFTDLTSGFTPPMYLPALANTYFGIERICSKLVLDSHQRFSYEILYLILCSDHSKIFFFGSKHSLELMTTITLTFSWPIFTLLPTHWMRRLYKIK